MRRGTIVGGRRGCRIGAIVPIVEIIRDIVAVSQACGVFRTEDVRLTQAEIGGLADIRALAVVACPRRIRRGGHEPDRNEHGGEDGESARVSFWPSVELDATDGAFGGGSRG